MARLALLATAVAAATAQRTEVPISLGWRFSPAAPPACAYPVALTDTQCYQVVSANATDAANCEAAACAQNKELWLWCDGGACGSKTCSIGFAGMCQSGKSGWVGGMRNTTNTVPADAAEAKVNFDDSAWTITDIPHDAVITGNYTSSANGPQGFLPPTTVWYRKHFVLPQQFAGQAVTLIVDAALSTSSWFVNGVQVVPVKSNGYLPLVLRLDTLPAVTLSYGGGTNIIAAYIDGIETTGWWYEGSGLVRDARLIFTPALTSIAPYGVATPHYLSGPYTPNGESTGAGITAASGVLTPTVTVAAGTNRTANVEVTFTLYAADGVTVVANSSAARSIPGGNSSTLTATPMALTNPQAWSVPRPYLYTLSTAVYVGGALLDSVNTSVGLRNIVFDQERGLLLNEQPVKMRGFCEHESFIGVGAALPARVDLLRVQQMRGVGGNAWRTSHNPQEPALFDIADRLGILVLGENRVLATMDNCPGCPKVPFYDGSIPSDMQLMVLRDRTHPSIIWWSLCNEAGCGDGSLLQDTVIAAKEAAFALDGTRAITANMGWLSPVTPGTPMSDVLDVMGMSHEGNTAVNTWRQMEPEKPLAMTECCSCETQRGEDDDLPLNATDAVYFSNENSACLAAQTQVSNGPSFVAATMVWTLHDYIGEPGNWPHVSSSFGSFDLAGFPKSPVWWYRSWWLANITADDAGRPPLSLPQTSAFCRIVESWQPSANGTRRIHVYSNAPLVALSTTPADAKQAGYSASPVPVPAYGAAVFYGVPFAPGKVTASCLGSDGRTVLASHTITSWGAAASIALQIDAPSPTTGTGSRVYLDGADVALVRATLLDASGAVVQNGQSNISFAVTAGPGLVWGTGNGDPSDHVPAHSAWRTAYHGLVRAVIRTTVDASGSAADRALRAAVNPDAGGSAWSSSILQGSASSAPTSITITASSPGLPSASITIALSTDPADSVLAVAGSSIGVADIGE